MFMDSKSQHPEISVIRELIYMFNIAPIKILPIFSTDIDKIVQTFTSKGKGTYL